MNSPELTLTTEFETLTFELQEQEVEIPTLPITLLTDPYEFEKKVQKLRKDYEADKPKGIFF
jgi:hypothetical protein